MTTITDQIPEFPACPHCEAKLFTANARIGVVCEKPTQYVDSPLGRLVPCHLYDKVGLPEFCSQCDASTTNLELLKFQRTEEDADGRVSNSAFFTLGWFWILLIRKLFLTTVVEFEVPLPLCGNCITSEALKISEVDFPQKIVRVFVHEHFPDRIAVHPQ